MQPGKGTITIDEPTSAYEGVYQCFASNDVGTAMSDTTHAVKAAHAQFQHVDVATEVSATVGDSLRVSCRSTHPGVPDPQIAHYSWRDGDSTWPLSRRVQIDDNGMCCRPVCHGENFHNQQHC